MTTYTDAERFLQAVFGSDYGTHARFAGNTLAGGWKEKRSLGALDPTGDCYLSIAAFLKGSPRLVAKALEVRCLVIDDVGELIPDVAVEMALGTPTGIVSSSAAGCHWWYRLSTPVAVEAWPAFIAGVMKVLGHTLHGSEAHHVFRLPMGVYSNPKKPERHGFRPALVELNPGVTLDPAKITPVHDKTTQKKAAPSGGGAEIKLELDDLRLAMSWIKNDARFDARNGDWVNVIGHGLKALCVNDADGLTVFDEWSQPHYKYDEVLVRKAWVSFGARGLESKGGKLKGLWQAANPEGFAQMFAAKAFDDNPPPPPPPPTGPAAVQFQLGANSQILSTMENAARGLNGLGFKCSYDEFHHRAYVQRASGVVERLTDKLVLLLRVELNTAYGRDFGPVHIGDAITALAYLHAFNPVCDMLAEAEAGWDGVLRLDRLGPDYFHTEDTALARACFRKVMIAAVRRARRPGCKFDQILVLESPEGWDKSTAWAVLAGAENFSDASILGKDARAVQEELADVWIHEIADLSGLARAEVEAVKAFASRQVDRARPAYGKVLIDQPRQSIEVGTTNSDDYLMSQTGNRRFWPFRLGDRVETARLAADRMQLWGEAARLESSGETLVLDKALWGAAAVAQEERRVVDPWEDELANLPDTLIKDVRGMQTITNLAIHDHLGGHRGGRLTGAAGRKINEIMKRHGWTKGKVKDALGEEVRGYTRGTDIFRSVSASVPKNTF